MDLLNKNVQLLNILERIKFEIKRNRSSMHFEVTLIMIILFIQMVLSLNDFNKQNSLKKFRCRRTI